MRITRAPIPGVVRQPGIALLTGLVFMVAISLLALVASGSMIQQRRMAGNFADRQRAGQAAAVAIARGRAFLFGLGHGSRLPACMNHCFPPPLSTVIHQAADMPASPEFQDASWWQSRAVEVGIDPIDGSRIDGIWGFAYEPPRFLIEEIHFDSVASVSGANGAPALEGIGYYRIVGRGNGISPAAVAVSEAIVARPWVKDAGAEANAPEGNNFCEPFERWYDCGRMAWRRLR